MAKQKNDLSLDSILQQYATEKETEFISTSSVVLDSLLGGGISPGSMYCAWGCQGSGKSTISFQILKSLLKKDMKCAFIDVEKAFNKNQQTTFGLREYVENGQLTVLTVDNYDEIYKVCKALAESDQYKLIVIDSETEIMEAYAEDIDVTSNMPGQKARQSQKVLSALKSIFFKHNVASLWLCHARANLDMSGNPYAEKEKQAGGFGIKHTPDVIMKVQVGQKIKEGDQIEGQILHLMAEKNKFAKPFVKIDVKLYFGKGINKKMEIINLAIDFGLIKQSGAYFTVGEKTVKRQISISKNDRNDFKITI